MIKQLKSKKCGKPSKSLDMTASYLIKLAGPVSTPRTIREAADMDGPPDIRKGSGEDGEEDWYHVDAIEGDNVEHWLSEQYPNYQPVFLPVKTARESLFDFSAYPTLGIDTTLPHHRPSNTVTSHLPVQYQYPVRYFFYGTLADPDVLSRQLGLPPDDPPLLEPASISGGTLKSWGQYKALVDGPSSAHLDGWAFKVISSEHEEALRIYETEKYEVVRCTIEKGLEQVQGCTFRFTAQVSLP